MAKTLHATKRMNGIDKNKPIVTKDFVLPGTCKGCHQQWNLKLKVVANAGVTVKAAMTGICESQIMHPITRRKSKCGTGILFLLRDKMPDK